MANINLTEETRAIVAHYLDKAHKRREKLMARRQPKEIRTYSVKPKSIIP